MDMGVYIYAYIYIHMDAYIYISRDIQGYMEVALGSRGQGSGSGACCEELIPLLLPRSGHFRDH